MDLLEKKQISGPALKRLQKEFQSFVTNPPDGLQLCQQTLKGENLGVWQVRKLNGKGHKNPTFRDFPKNGDF